MPQNEPKPKPQVDIVRNTETKLNRSLEQRRDNDNVKDLTIKLVDIDTAVLYYLENIVLSNIKDNGNSFKVPIIYGSPEKWKSAQADGYYKDKDDKIQIPVVIFRRTSMSKNRDLSNKVDANSPNVYQEFVKAWSPLNKYMPFAVLNNMFPVKEFYSVIVPEYVTLSYEFLIWTDTIEQMNDIIEAINYSEGAYWGEPNRFKFRTRIDDYTNTTELNSDNDRMIRTAFTLTLNGYIVSDSLNRALANKIPKTQSSKEFVVTSEIDGLTLEDLILQSRGIGGKKQSTGNATGIQQPVSNNSALTYLQTNITKTADTIVAPDTAIINNSSILLAPYPLAPTTKDNFAVLVNGDAVPASYVISISQVSTTVVVVLDTAGLGYSLDSGDIVNVIGKFVS